LKYHCRESLKLLLLNEELSHILNSVLLYTYYNTGHIKLRSAFKDSSYSYLFWELVSKPAEYTHAARQQRIQEHSLRHVRVISPTLSNEAFIYFKLHCDVLRSSRRLVTVFCLL